MPLWKDIYFACPACRGHLMVERSGAGFSAPCPHCGASVRVPHRSDLPPRVARGLRLAAINGAVILLALAGALAALNPFNSIPDPEAAGVAMAATRETGAAALQSPVPSSEAVEGSGAFVPLEKNRQLELAQADLQARYDELGNWVLQNVRGKYPLPERLVSRLKLSPVDENFALHGDVAEVLRVLPQEKVLVDDALLATRETLSQMEEAMITVTQSAPDKATIFVPAYAETGARVRDDLYSALVAALGEDRFNRMLDLTDMELDRRYHYFGNAQRTMVFEQAYTAEDPENPFLVIKDGWIRPDGPNSRVYEVSETSVRELPKQYLTYLNFLPAYVAAYAKP